MSRYLDEAVSERDEKRVVFGKSLNQLIRDYLELALAGGDDATSDHRRAFDAYSPKGIPRGWRFPR